MREGEEGGYGQGIYIRFSPSKHLPCPRLSQASSQYGFHSWQHPWSDHGQTKQMNHLSVLRLAANEVIAFPLLSSFSSSATFSLHSFLFSFLSPWLMVHAPTRKERRVHIPAHSMVLFFVDRARVYFQLPLYFHLYCPQWTCRCTLNHSWETRAPLSERGLDSWVLMDVCSLNTSKVGSQEQLLHHKRCLGAVVSKTNGHGLPQPGPLTLRSTIEELHECNWHDFLLRAL